jgi:hypothetical protein
MALLLEQTSTDKQTLMNEVSSLDCAQYQHQQEVKQSRIVH